MDGSHHVRIAGSTLAGNSNLDPGPIVLYQRGHTGRRTAPEVLNEGAYSKEEKVPPTVAVVIEASRR